MAQQAMVYMDLAAYFLLIPMVQVSAIFMSFQAQTALRLTEHHVYQSHPTVCFYSAAQAEIVASAICFVLQLMVRRMLICSISMEQMAQILMVRCSIRGDIFLD